MSNKMINWAYGHELKAAKLLVLVTIADMADDFGVCEASREYLMWKTGYSRRSMVRVLNEFRDADLLHTERRQLVGVKSGRMTDVIVLHPGTEGDKGDWPGRAAWLEQMKESRAAFETPADPEEDEEDQASASMSAKMAHSNKTPSQDLSAKMAHSSEPVDNSGSCVPNRAQLSAKSCTNAEGAIKRIARTDLTQSCPVLSSPEEEATAGAVETGPDMTGPDTTPTATATEQAERGPSVAGVPVRLLRWKVRPVLDQVEDQVIEEMIRIVMSRYDAVRSPLGLMITAVRADDGQDLIEEATARAAAASEAPWGPAWMSPDTVDREWSEMLQQTRDQETAEAARPRSCPTHNVDFVGPECPSCRADRLAGAQPAGPEPATPHTPGGGVDGAELRRRLRAQRAARVGGDR
ncbi:helix-turn-helix domain-containing protein [Rothia kristinae]|uniref:helix-turn-helix domain-containing protein n=1 Tax=Rothia kristinae TaxID=37923 RepID=UPI00119D19EC|nr:helix-turn-helix domain-containing protein [Rothia kristinae]